ncbi:hypothetical protein [Sphingobium yanoikuyae]|uniref:Uncharacterized protein n=1 Tax=Sphingobium yanoikuyae TaxID=13690 RepID=A0A291MZZ1_SPHYA|nr:hypothetical protein [Sphingobium yanoikuyae]ATI80667.1 hypothetical protein A6768_12150 [Sphingobium yanoikuyae]
MPDRDGRFEVIVSQQRPKDWKGDRHFLYSEAGDIMIRQFAYDRGIEIEAYFAIERLDRAPLRSRLTSQEIARG